MGIWLDRGVLRWGNVILIRDGIVCICSFVFLSQKQKQICGMWNDGWK